MSTKYIGMDVHEATTIAVMNSAGTLVMESIVETKAATIVQFFEGCRGQLCVTLEEGTWATQFLCDLLKPHVTKVVKTSAQAALLRRRATRVTGSMHANWPNSYALDFCRRSIMARPDSER